MLHSFIPYGASASTRGVGVNSSRLLWMEWRQALPNWIVGPSRRFTSVARGRSWKLLNFSSTNAGVSQSDRLMQYPSTDASQSRSCNTRKVCDWLLSLWWSRQHQASDTPSIKRWRRRPVWMGRYSWLSLTFTEQRSTYSKTFKGTLTWIVFNIRWPLHTALEHDV